jgi:hypothetical protein
MMQVQQDRDVFVNWGVTLSRFRPPFEFICERRGSGDQQASQSLVFPRLADTL